MAILRVADTLTNTNKEEETIETVVEYTFHQTLSFRILSAEGTTPIISIKWSLGKSPKFASYTCCKFDLFWAITSINQCEMIPKDSREQSKSQEFLRKLATS